MNVKKDSKIKRKIISALELPKDITLGFPVVSMTGKEEIAISNHKGLTEYGAGHVQILTSVGNVKIFGANLVLKEISAENIIISGMLEKVVWG